MKWKAERPDVVFVFSRDICQLKGLAGIEAVYLDKGEVYEDGCCVYGPSALRISGFLF